VLGGIGGINMMQQAGGMDVNSLMQKIRRLVTLDTTVFDEVRTDASFTPAAVVVAAVATLLFGLGGWLWAVFEDYNDTGEILLKSAIIGTVVSLILWAVAIGVVYVLLTQVFRARADMNELVRVMGLATLPLALGFLFFIPTIGYAISLTALALLFGLSLIAVQSATDASPGKAIASTAAGFFVWALILVLLSDSGDFITDKIVPNIFIFSFS
jgi:hypothetical protein